MPACPQQTTSPSATKAYVRYFPTRFRRKAPSVSGEHHQQHRGQDQEVPQLAPLASLVVPLPSSTRAHRSTRGWRVRLAAVSCGAVAGPLDLVSCLSVMCTSPPNTNREQALRSQHQDDDQRRQGQNLGRRAGQEELARRLGLGDAERRGDGAQRLSAPPKTTTRKVSTMYSEPLVGPVDPMVVKAAPAMPASPQPSAKAVAVDLAGVDPGGRCHHAVLGGGANPHPPPGPAAG